MSFQHMISYYNVFIVIGKPIFHNEVIKKYDIIFLVEGVLPYVRLYDD